MTTHARRRERRQAEERLALVLAAAAAGALGIAFALQYIGGYEPCTFCVWERWPYALAVPILLVGAAISRPRPALVVAAALLFGNALLSFYHVGVEQGWLQLPSTCVAGSAASSIEELRAQLQVARPTCDQAALRVLGVSLAGWNGLLALALGVLALLGGVGRAPEIGRPPAGTPARG